MLTARSQRTSCASQELWSFCNSRKTSVHSNDAGLPLLRSSPIPDRPPRERRIWSSIWSACFSSSRRWPPTRLPACHPMHALLLPSRVNGRHGGMRSRPSWHRETSKQARGLSKTLSMEFVNARTAGILTPVWRLLFEQQNNETPAVGVSPGKSDNDSPTRSSNSSDSLTSLRGWTVHAQAWGNPYGTVRGTPNGRASCSSSRGRGHGPPPGNGLGGFRIHLPTRS